MRICDVIMVCSKCGWVGKVCDAEPDIDGDGNLGCPKLCTDLNGKYEIVNPITDQSFMMN